MDKVLKTVTRETERERGGGGEREGERDRQIDRQKERDRQTGRQRDRWKSKPTFREFVC